MERKIVGWDVSPDANTPTCVCTRHHRARGPYSGGEPLYEGEEWGRDEGQCAVCGEALPLELVWE